MKENTPPYQVRYGTFSKSVNDQPWRDCMEVEPLESVLAIKWDADSIDYVPLHVIRGPVQVRRKPEVKEATE